MKKAKLNNEGLYIRKNVQDQIPLAGARVSIAVAAKLDGPRHCIRDALYRFLLLGLQHAEIESKCPGAPARSLSLNPSLSL